MKYMIQELPEYQIAYMRRIGKYGAENYQLMSTLKDWAKNKQLFNHDNIIFGLAQDNPQVVPNNLCRYDIGITIEDKNLLDEHVTYTVLPKGKYLVFEIEHTELEIQNFWQHFVNIIYELQAEIDTARIIIEQYPIALIERGYCLMCVPLK